MTSTSDLVLRGGTVLTAEGPRRTDVRVAGGVVESLQDGAGPAREEVDASGLWVLPGAVDAHVHGRDPGQPEKEDFASLTLAAAAGGVTTVVDMPNTIPAVDSAPILLEKAEQVAVRAVVDFALWGLVRSGSTVQDVRGLLDAGAVGLKAFLGYAFRTATRQVVYTLDLGEPGIEMPPDYGTLARLAPALAGRDALLAVHAEDPGVLRELARPLGVYADVLAARPALAEAIAIGALGAISRTAGLRIRVVHVSSASGLEAARLAIADGARLQLETCPHYLWLTEADFGRVGPAMKIYPPVRTEADRAALVAGLGEGLIGSVATDHAPHADSEKLGRSLEDASPGSPGVETLYLSSLELARRLGDAWRAADWVSGAPARELRLHPRKGVIAPGADADLVLVDPDGETVVRAERMHSRQRHAALEGRRFGFAIRAVWSRGEPVARAGEVVAEPGRGRLIRPREQEGPAAPGREYG